MPSASHPANEAERLAALRSYAVLDTACEAAFDNIVELAALLTSSPMSTVSLVDSDRQWFKARHGLQMSESPRGSSFCAHAILQPNEPLIVPDARADPRFADNPLVTGEFGLRFYAGVPLVNRDNEALGTLCVLDRQPRMLTEMEQKILVRLAETVMTTLELRRAMLHVQQVALVDFLTGLRNRPAMIAAIGEAMATQERQGGCFCLLYMDLDGFKAINDRHGHAGGDAALREVALALQMVVRSEDVAGRLGGDEFALLITEDAAGAAVIANRFREELARRMLARGWDVTASIGLACFVTAPASVEEALNRADVAMYAAKQGGGDRIVHAAPRDAEPRSATNPVPRATERHLVAL